MAYLAMAGKQMATRDFEGLGLKDVLKKSLSALRHLIRLAKHAKQLGGWQFQALRWRKENAEVGIPNEAGEYQYFPAEFLDWYQSIPPSFLSKMAIVIERERALTVGVRESGGFVEETVTIREKSIFIRDVSDDDDDSFLFPELIHGQEVVLEGRLTRGNSSWSAKFRSFSRPIPSSWTMYLDAFQSGYDAPSERREELMGSFAALDWYRRFSVLARASNEHIARPPATTTVLRCRAWART